MKYVVLLLCWVPLLSFSPTAPAAEIGGAELERNPFARPQVPHGVASVAGAPAAPSVEEEVLELRATLVSGSEHLANVNGLILAPGEKVLGYRLLRVGEGEAVLVKNGKEVLLTMHEEK